MNKSLAALTGAIAAVLAGGLIAAPAGAVESAAAPALPGSAAPAMAAHQPLPSADAEALLQGRNFEDGVKGKIKNFSGHPVKITFNDNQTRTLADRDEVTYYSGKYAIVKMSRTDGSHESRIQLVDHVYKQPITVFWPNAKDFDTKTERRGWDEQESHHELWGDTKLWLKREVDGWNGGHETSSTSDWAVFTVHIDGLPK